MSCTYVYIENIACITNKPCKEIKKINVSSFIQFVKKSIIYLYFNNPSHCSVINQGNVRTTTMA